VICHICAAPSGFLLEKDGFRLYKCPKCALVFVHPTIPIETLRKNIYSAESGFQTNRAENLESKPENPRYKSVLDYICSLNPSANILDVGSGGGHFMYPAKKRGFRISGVELNGRLAESARAQNLDVFSGLLEEAPFAEHSFDAVFMGELIEHVPNPRQLIKEGKRMIASKGRLIITTPNLDCLWSKTTFLLFRYFGIPWSSVTPPYHLFQFSSANLDLLLKQEGWSLVTEWYLPIPSLRYELGSLHLLKRYKKEKTLRALAFMAFSYAVYAVIHTFIKIFHPFFRRDFEMVKVYEPAA